MVRDDEALGLAKVPGDSFDFCLAGVVDVAIDAEHVGHHQDVVGQVVVGDRARDDLAIDEHLVERNFI